MILDLIETAKKDYPEFKFKKGSKFMFRPPRTIVLGPEEPLEDLLFLHELSHAILGHKTFKTDIERLKMESAAWGKTRELAEFYNIQIDEEAIERELDTYRDWLHKKSRCPKCGLTRFQTPDSEYHCPRCENLA